MTIIDLPLLAALFLFALWTFIALRLPRAALPLALAPLAGLMVAQLIIEGPYWHLLPAYLLAALCALIGFTGFARAHWLRAVAARLAIAVVASVTALAWVFPPVPLLAPPSGPYAVATQTYRWVDANRGEPTSPVASERRNVIVQAWYPAAVATRGVSAPYLDGLGRLPPTVSLLPSFLMVHYDRIETAPLGEPVSGAQQRWPVVLFSPGYGAARGVYTSLLRDLASRGVVVIALDHPFESAVTELADGRLATPIESFSSSDPDRQGYMETRLQTRIGDVRFVLDQLDSDESLGPLAGRLDTSRIAAIGHSFGGATAIASAAADPRLRAAVDIDGALYGPAITARLHGPAMVIDSDHAVTGHNATYFEGTDAMLAAAGPGSARMELKGTHHYSFTDALLLLSPPARWAATRVPGLTQDPAAALRLTADHLVEFLAGPLRL